MASQAWSLGIGEWRVLSHIGEPVVAEADIVRADGELVDADCFRLVYAEGSGDFPAIQDARLTTRSAATGPRLRLVSPRAMMEPIAQIRIRFTCGMSLTRDMLLFFSPREYEAPLLLPDHTDADAAGADKPTRESRIKPGAGPRNTSADTEAGSRRGVSGARPPGGRHGAGQPDRSGHPRANLPTRATAKPATSGTLTPRLVLSSDLDPAIVERLRLSTELRNVARQATEEERERLRRLYRTMMQLADMKEGTAGAAPDATGSAEPAATPTLPTTPAAIPAAPPATPPQALALPPLESSHSWWLPLVGLLLAALLIGLLLWYMRRSKANRALPEPIEPMPSIHQVSIKSEAAKRAEGDETLDELLKKEAGELDSAPAASAPSAFANIRGVTVHAESSAFMTSYRTMLDLADSMMAFGLVSDAADALKEYIEDHPSVAVEPWLKLLDILRHTGKRAEFDQYSLKLRQHFNLDLPAWDAPDSLPEGSAPGPDGTTSDSLVARFRDAPSPLEAFPHVRDRLVSLWGTPEAAQFLQHLMRDNRAGKRRGFPLIVIDDILLLLDVIQELTGVDAEASISGNPDIFSDTW